MDNQIPPEYVTMSEEDWEQALKEWAESIDCIGTIEQPVPPTKQPEESGRWIKVIRPLGRGTEKAKFFLTEDGLQGKFGFWVPRTAILQEEFDKLYIADWCKIKTIEYI